MELMNEYIFQNKCMETARIKYYYKETEENNKQEKNWEIKWAQNN